MQETSTDDKRAAAEPSTKRLRGAAILLIVVFSAVWLERQFSTWWGQYTVSQNPLQGYTMETALQLLRENTAAQPTDGPQRLILANFSAYWCGACRQLERGALSAASVAEHLQRNYYYVRLEQTEASDAHWFEQYQITSYPTLLLLDGNGNCLSEVPAISRAAGFLEQLKARRARLAPLEATLDGSLSGVQPRGIHRCAKSHDN